jgi:hypothetical protein
MHAILSYPDGTPIILAGPCWPFCVFVTFPVIIGVATLVSYFLVIDDTFGLVCNKSFIMIFICLMSLTQSCFSSAELDSYNLFSLRCICAADVILCRLPRSWTDGASYCKYTFSTNF